MLGKSGKEVMKASQQKNADETKTFIYYLGQG